MIEYKAVLLISYILLQNTNFMLTERILFPTRIACEAQEGMLNKPFTGGDDFTYTLTLNELDFEFMVAGCEDIPAGLTR